MSRSKMADLIDAGAVKVNWREGAKTKTQVESGDIISLRQGTHKRVLFSSSDQLELLLVPENSLLPETTQLTNVL